MRKGSIVMIATAVVVVGLVGFYVVPSLVNSTLAQSQASLTIYKLDPKVMLPDARRILGNIPDGVMTKYPELRSGLEAADTRYSEVEEFCKKEPVECGGVPLGRPPPPELDRPPIQEHMTYDKAKSLVLDKEFEFKSEGGGFRTVIGFHDSIYNVWVSNPFTHDELLKLGDNRFQ